MAEDEREEQITAEDDEMRKNYESIERYREYQQRLRDAALSQSEEVAGQMFGREWNMGGFGVNPYSPGLGFPNIEFPSEDNIPLFTDDIINTDMLNQYIITPLEYASDKIEALDETELLNKTKTALPGKLKLIQYALGAYDIYNAEDPTKEFAGIAVSTLAGFIPGIGPELSLLLSLTGWDEKIGGYVVDYFRDPPTLYDPGAIMAPEFAGFTQNFLQSHTSVNMEELLQPYIPPSEEAMGDEQAFRSLAPNMEELLNQETFRSLTFDKETLGNEEIFRSTLQPESDQGNQYTEQEVNNQNVTVNIAVEGQGDENGIVNKLVARLGEVFENMNTSGFGVV